MQETWNPIYGYEDLYQISSFGQVRQITRKQKTLKQRPDKDGYLRVSLHRNSKPRTFQVHRLVAQAFIGECPQGYVVDHKNDIKSDNSLDNLQYLTRKENSEKAAKTGRYHSRCKLTPAQVNELRTIYADVPNPVLAKRLGVQSKTIKRAKEGFYWAHLV